MVMPGVQMRKPRVNVLLPVDDTSPHYGASFLFMTYFLDRFGEEATKALVGEDQFSQVNGGDAERDGQAGHDDPEAVDFGVWIQIQPGGQERLIEHEILFSPCDQARFVRE